MNREPPRLRLFRQADPRYPFAWESRAQPEGRWHAAGEGPAHYLADTPDGAWAELLRHEEITTPGDVATIRRALWVVELDEVPAAIVLARKAAPARAVSSGTATGESRPTHALSLTERTLTGGVETWPRCQEAAREARAGGATRVDAPSAALLPEGATGFVTANGLQPAPPRDGRVLVVYGAPAEMTAWRAVDAGHPPAHLLARVRHYSPRRT